MDLPSKSPYVQNLACLTSLFALRSEVLFVSKPIDIQFFGEASEAESLTTKRTPRFDPRFDALRNGAESFAKAFPGCTADHGLRGELILAP